MAHGHFPAVAALLFAARAVTAQSATPAQPGMVVTTQWLADHLRDPNVVVFSMEHSAGDFASGHIPGARHLDYNDITPTVNGMGTELPAPDELARRLGALGIGRNTHVVVAAPMLPMATRALLTLAYAGVQHASLLDGGAMKWAKEGRAMSRDAAPAPSTATFDASPDRSLVVTADWVRGHLGAAGVSLIDTRTDAEYHGGTSRTGRTSEGHLTGARQLQWEQLTADSDNAVLKPVAELRRLYADRVAPADTVVTYCAVGYRASVTWFVARYLGYNAKLYDGSYEEWSKLGYPVTTEPAAPRKP